jgi:hypothetical protein
MAPMPKPPGQLQPYAEVISNEITGIEFYDPATYNGGLLLLAGISLCAWTRLRRRSNWASVGGCLPWVPGQFFCTM